MPHKLSVKLFLQHPLVLEEVVPVFHGWIQRQAVPGHLLIDVANYAHVEAGPGVALVAHEANFYLDLFAARPGLTYQRKQPAPGTFADRLHQAFADAISAAARLEEEPLLNGKPKFHTDSFTLKIPDRLLAPNTDGTLAVLRPELESFATRLFGPNTTLTRYGEARDLFELEIRPASGVPLSTLLSRLGQPVTA
ncbi:MAG: hypothetical protein ABSH20_20420 [Tepidisphaeraceae bacterium]